jgi:hypothetical protein
MGTYGLEGVMRAWELEKLTPEQTIGQMLQLMKDFEERLRDIERKYRRLNKALSAAPPSLQSLESEVE